MLFKHIDQYIADTFSAILQNWDLSKDATTTDSRSNIVRILNAIRITCFGYNLDLAIKGLDSNQVKE